MGLTDYTRIKKLGKGSFGEVFLVSDKRNGQQFVMKEVDLAQFGAKGRREALKEVAFLHAMNHPCIVGYREFFEAISPNSGQKMLYIVMEYADGGDLDGRIKSMSARGSAHYFAETQILEWFVQICLAVKHIHDRKIIHRDLKAENIFLKQSSQKGGAPRCLLGDFGISKSMASTMANAITRIGTPYYLSPEICMNKPYNAKSDLWSLGVVLYELMSLKHPFDATSMEGLLNKIVKSQPPPLPKHYSIELRTVVDSLLSKQPAKRPNVNALLKLPFLAAYVSRASLSQEQLADEFSHTVIHSDASARGAGGAGAMAMPQSNQVQHRPSAQQQQQQQPQQGIPRAKPRESHAPPLHPQQPPQQRYPPIHPQQPQQQHPQQNGWEEQKEAPHRAASPYRQQFSNNAAAAASPASHYPPPTGRNSARSVAPVYGSSRDGPGPGPQVPPSPYAGLSNADAIRMIREKKEHELREARAAQLEHQRRREQAEASVAAASSFASPAETERDRQLRAREREKERAMAAAHGQQDFNLPPMLRQQQQQQQQYVNHQAQAQVNAILHGGGGGGGRGIPAVSRAAAADAATPLHGAPYNPRLGGGAAPTRLQQQQLAAAEAARRVREEEMSRMRVNYFRERKQKRESKLAAINRGAPQQQQQQGSGPRPLPPPSSYPPPSHQRIASRPLSADRYGPGHAMGAPAPAYGRRAGAGSQEPARWR